MVSDTGSCLSPVVRLHVLLRFGGILGLEVGRCDGTVVEGVDVSWGVGWGVGWGVRGGVGGGVGWGVGGGVGAWVGELNGGVIGKRVVGLRDVGTKLICICVLSTESTCNEVAPLTSEGIVPESLTFPSISNISNFARLPISVGILPESFQLQQNELSDLSQ